MRKIALALAVMAAAMPSLATAQTRVNGYYRQNGTYVAPHYRSAPNSSTYDNYSTRPNVNPYTGRQGTQSAQPSYGYRAPPPPCYYNCPR